MTVKLFAAGDMGLEVSFALKWKRLKLRKPEMGHRRLVVYILFYTALQQCHVSYRPAWE
jgi:hypothetical protein